MKAVLAIVSIAALAACSSTGPVRESQQLFDYRANSGPPVDGFRAAGRIRSWTPLGDSAVAVWTGSNRAWLLELDEPCPALDFAEAIQVSDSVGRVSAGFDRVTAIGGGPTVSCRIEQIRPIDVAALRRAEQARRTSP